MGFRNLPGPVFEGRTLVILRTHLLLCSYISSKFGGQPSNEHVILLLYSGTVAILSCYFNIFGLKSALYFKYWYFVSPWNQYAFYIEHWFYCLWGLYWFQFINVSKILCMHCMFRIQQIQDEVWWKEWQRVSAHQSNRSWWWGRIHLYC